jgi:uncharacterized protein with HEPN domain
MLEAIERIAQGFPQPGSGYPLAPDHRHASLLVHDYCGIDTDAVWAVVTHDLTELECKLRALLEALEESR